MAKKKATKNKTIKPKPTKYRGTVYRSRLEAKWAVFLDFHFMTNAFEFEPKKFHLVDMGWDYLPDFYVNFGGMFNFYLEVKPTMPDRGYIEDLAKFVPILPAPLILCVGSFFKSVPKVYRFNNDGLEDPEGLLDVFFEGEEALESAQSFRFDLPENKRPRPSFRKASGATPLEHYDHGTNKEKKDIARELELKRDKANAAFKKEHRQKRKRLK